MPTELEVFQSLVDNLWNMVFGTIRRPEIEFKGMMTKTKRKRDKLGRYTK